MHLRSRVLIGYLVNARACLHYLPALHAQCTSASRRTSNQLLLQRVVRHLVTEAAARYLP